MAIYFKPLAVVSGFSLKYVQRYFGIVLLLGLVILIGCNTRADKNTKENSSGGYKLDPRMANVDSLVVVFYNDPYGEDSLRYTRYYKIHALTDSNDVRMVKKQFESGFSKFESKKNCRGEGKIWCFSKGKIMQTLYFSTNTEISCSFLYFIKDGDFYYGDIPKSFVDWLGLKKKNAV